MLSLESKHQKLSASNGLYPKPYNEDKRKESDINFVPKIVCNARRSGLVNLDAISVENDFSENDYLE